MAEALTRPRSRRSKKPDAHERELKRLKLSVCDDVGFRLFLATYDQPKRRDELIARVVKVAEAEKVRITRLDLAEAGPETNLVGLLRAHLRETDLPPGWRQAVMVTGIEQRLDYARGREGYAFLHQANLLRDALPEAAPVPVVLWLSRIASAALPAEAPDLWHWRAANFDFTGDVAPRLELLRELTTLQPEEGDGLSDEQRRARIRMLEELVAELEREGPPKSKRQAAERADLLMQLGIEAAQLARFTQAMPYFERALERYREIGDRRREDLALGCLGMTWLELGDPRRAIERWEQSVGIAREIGDRRAESSALDNLANAYAVLGEPRQAIEHHEQSLAIAREISDRRSEGIALSNLGNAYATLGEPRRAIEHHEQSLAIAREIGDRRGEGAALGNLGNAYVTLGEPRRAIEHYEQYLAIAPEIGDRRGEGQVLGSLGIVYAALGEPQRAIDRRGEGNSLYGSGLAFDDLGDLAEAVSRMEEALRIYEEIKDPNAERARAQLTVWDWE
jgi:tetratricopeptide (TPR) repeat protein